MDGSSKAGNGNKRSDAKINKATKTRREKEMKLLETYKTIFRIFIETFVAALFIILGIALFVLPFAITGVLIDNDLPMLLAPFVCAFMFFMLLGLVDHYGIFWESNKEE